MIDTTTLLSSYVGGIRCLCDAGCVSLFVPLSVEGLSHPILVHQGELDPVPELADIEAATAFAEQVSLENATAEDESSTAPPTQVLSRDSDCGLIALPQVQIAWPWEPDDPEHANRRRGDAQPTPELEIGAWLGLRFPPGKGPLLKTLGHNPLPAALQENTEPARWWNWLFALGGALASHTTQVSNILRDPMTGLPDRRGFQAGLAEELERAHKDETPLSLLFINPDEFFTVNELFGREKGDRCVAEIGRRLRTALRSTDLISRYGGVIFAVLLVGSDAHDAQEAAQRALQHLSEAAYLNGALRLGFSIGVGVFDPSDTSIRNPLDLIRRSDQALSAAKRLGGGRVVGWEEGSGAEELNSLDRLSGIFTGNMAKDYRNMVLLWDTVSVIAVNPDFDELVEQTVERLYATFKPQHLGIFARTLDNNLNLLRGLTRGSGQEGSQRHLETLELDFQRQGLLSEAIGEREPRERTFSHQQTGPNAKQVGYRCCAVPLLAGKDCLGCLYLDWRADSVALDASDMVFLQALGSQLAIAMDRARLTEIEDRRKDWERRQLRAEINELRHALQQAKLVFKSAEMEDVVSTARRVATTDVTVLITGSSGTGKELLARTIHELSPRSAKPFVIVDCGAIPTTLIESELFGHEKGAYTGAQSRRAGRLAEANEGTVLLDEIGELPLEVQSKLLRFVQDKQFIAVGGSKTQRVDVRILAATNRDLSEEVAAGRFREDLFYRLHVIHLRIPPLRNRPDDILHLARHFLETYSFQYQKKIRGFTAEAERVLLHHLWPGNVRELQNRIMQGVVLCEGRDLEASDLGFSEGTEPASVGNPWTLPRASAGTDGGFDAEDATLAEPAPPTGQPADKSEQIGLQEALAELQVEFDQQIATALHNGARRALPFGRWVSEDLLLIADRETDGMARRGAELLGIPESTYRRRLRKAKDQVENDMAPRPRDWSNVRAGLERLVRATDLDDQNVLDLVENALLREILTHCPGDVRTGSALLGVSAPTFRRRVNALSLGSSA